jgi:hypothetical protein
MPGRQSVIRLFRERVRPGMTLAEVAQVLDRPTWLADEHVWIVGDIGGHIPVGLEPDESVVVIDVLPEGDDRFHVYLRVSEEITAEDFLRWVRDGEDEAAAARVTVVEVGFSPPAPEPDADA